MPTPYWITDEVYYALANGMHKVRWVWMLGGNNGRMKQRMFTGEWGGCKIRTDNVTELKSPQLDRRKGDIDVFPKWNGNSVNSGNPINH